MIKIKMKLWGNVLLFAAPASLMATFMLSTIVGESDIFGLAGMVKYSWIMLFSIPICLLSLWVGFKLKQQRETYGPNYIVAFAVMAISIIFGSYSFIFSDSFSYDTEPIATVESLTDVEFPKQIKIATENWSTYQISHVKIVDKSEQSEFLYQINASDLWENKLNLSVKGLLPFEIQPEMQSYEHFAFYNVTTGEYNIAPTNEDCKYILMAYDTDLKEIMILISLSDQ